MKTKAKLYEEDLLLFTKSELVKINCPACDSVNYYHYCTKMNFEWVCCEKCSTIFLKGVWDNFNSIYLSTRFTK